MTCKQKAELQCLALKSAKDMHITLNIMLRYSIGRLTFEQPLQQVIYLSLMA